MNTTKKLIVAGLVIGLIVLLFFVIPTVLRSKTTHEAAPNSNYSPAVTKSTTTPILSQSNPPSSNPTPVPTTPVITQGGAFRSAPGERAQGTVHIIKIGPHYVVRIEDDFKIGGSPDPIVTFGNDNKADLSFNLGKLKGDLGSQNYDVPDSVDITRYRQVIIYCRSYHVPLGYADLKAVN